ncbi:MAG: delta-60 repeat domain-containing protein, partial [Betaproteobacteria bacterium]|nr:delta-60 repeat domain-containing protein [Betaproteobacteria bacterium]
AALLPNGRIVIVARAFVPSPSSSPNENLVIRLMPNGTLDSSFGMGGLKKYPQFADLQGIDGNSDGSLMLAGHRQVARMQFGAIAKTIAEPAAAPALIAVKSLKSHGAAGKLSMSINYGIPITGPITIEPRIAEPGQSHTLLFQFDAYLADGVTATVTNETGNPIGTLSVLKSGADVLLQLGNIPDRTRLTATLRNAMGTVIGSASMGFLVGDSNQSGQVDTSDGRTTRQRSGHAVIGDSLLFDFNLSGQINAVDIALSKARAGNALP